MNLEETIRQIEDNLGPKLGLDAWERTLYYHLFRHTHLTGKSEGVFGILPLAETLGMSDFKVREVIRAMNAKGCIRIEDRSRKGHLIRVLLPEEIPGLIPLEDGSSPTLDIEKVDFFTSRKYVAAILAREERRCFYCLRELKTETAVLDHVAPQVGGLDNSYRNIVAACHECNSLKQGRNGDEFLRDLYRKGLLTGPEFENRNTAVIQLRAGELRPILP